jgi:hypothetical protein
LVGSQSAMKCDAITGRENNNRSLIASEQANNRLSRSPLPTPPHKLIERVKRPSVYTGGSASTAWMGS